MVLVVIFEKNFNIDSDCYIPWCTCTDVLHIYIIYNIDMIIVWGPTDYAIKAKIDNI